MPAQVEVEAVSSDAAIDRRITGILRSTSWFEEVDVAVRDGVVFLDGRTGSACHRSGGGWVGEDPGRGGRGQPDPGRGAFALEPVTAVDEVTVLWEGAVRQLPLWGLGLLILVLTGVAAKLVTEGARRLLDRRLKPLVRM